MEQLNPVRINGRFASILQTWMQRSGHVDAALAGEIELARGAEWIELERWQQLLFAAAQLSQRDDVALEIGSGIQVAHTGVLGYLVLNTHTLAEAIETYLSCEHHFYGERIGQLQRGQQDWTLSWPDAAAVEHGLFVQVSISAFVSFLRQRFPDGCNVLEVTLPGPEPTNSGRFESFFHCPVRFGSTMPAIRFDTRVLQLRRAGLLVGDFATLQRHQQQAFQQVVEGSDPLLLRLQQLILAGLPHGQTGLSDIAQALHCSPRTLQRRLSQHQLRYQQLLDAVRVQLTQRYLEDSGLSLMAIALLLGFTDHSAFSRACKGWTGYTPSQLRQQRCHSFKPPLITSASAE